MALRMRWTSPVTYVFGQDQLQSCHFNFSEFNNKMDNAFKSPAFVCGFLKNSNQRQKGAGRRHRIVFKEEGEYKEPSFWSKVWTKLKLFVGINPPKIKSKDLVIRSFNRNNDKSQGVMYSEAFGFNVIRRTTKYPHMRTNLMWRIAPEGMPCYVDIFYVDNSIFDKKLDSHDPYFKSYFYIAN